VGQISQELAFSPAELQRLARLDIADLQDRYGVCTAAELSANIEQGTVHSHPAWEELIEWEQLETYLERLANASSTVTD